MRNEHWSIPEARRNTYYLGGGGGGYDLGTKYGSLEQKTKYSHRRKRKLPWFGQEYMPQAFS
jgi:hypothetical protein